MKIIVASVKTPFIFGGADALVKCLINALHEAGHIVELVTIPFRFYPESEVKRCMDIWENENFENINGFKPDAVICLQFPTFYLKHSNKILWLLHQHRAVYELWGTPYAQVLKNKSKVKSLKKDIINRDNKSIGSCKKVFTISERVSDRLRQYNKIGSVPLYHPPPFVNQLYSAKSMPYIFFPSRLEKLKRQSLLIKAMKYVKEPVAVIIAGDGGSRNKLQRKIDDLNLEKRVRLIGRITEYEMLVYYAHCLGVFFGPYDEDYGYVTLEAMLSSKPVITCIDSGGPTEFVVNNKTGFIAEPEPEAIAKAIDDLFVDQKRAVEMGRAGYKRYHEFNISWSNVVDKLLS